ncbi:MAG: ribosome small subunit-dependent GTPase A [Acidobacteriota bacterium]
MAKRSGRRKRPKRAGAKDSQVAQRLVKSVRESFEGGWEDSAFDLEADLIGAEPPKRRSPGAKSPTGHTASVAPTTPDAAEGAVRGEAEILSVASGVVWVTPDDDDQTVAGRDRGPQNEIEAVLPSHLAETQRSSVTVGDRVRLAEHGDDLRVEEVLPRRTWLSRPDPLNPRQERVVAANMDVVAIAASLVRPALRPALIDRYLIAVERGGATPILVVNKLDLVANPQREAELEPLTPYRDLELEIFFVSAETDRGIDQLRERLRGTTAVFVGHSGVGKSSLVNALAPQAEAATGEVDRQVGRGRHTTTRSNLYDLGPFRLIDTPGIRELGLWRLDPADLAGYFPEIAAASVGCRFADCTHIHEPDCAVRAAVDRGEISPARYATYRRIYESLTDRGP